jgi:hypothetical protein
MRIRELVHVSGYRLRISLDRSDGAMLIHLSNPAGRSQPIRLDLYGGELLAGFLMSARLAAGGELGEERSDGLFSCRFRLLSKAAIELSQDEGRLLLPERLWDRLYAELMLALAHGRNLVGQNPLTHIEGMMPPSRLLH